MPITNLPSLSADAPWTGTPPDPLDDPALYDGLLWRRPVAYLLDVVLIALAAFAVWALLGLLSILSFGLLLPLQVLALALLPLAYHTWFVGSRGATPGMRFLDVELRCWTGERPDYVRAALQTILFYVTVAPTTWLILIVALFNDRRRTLHDFLAGTVGVRHSRVGAGALPAAA